MGEVARGIVGQIFPLEEREYSEEG